MSDESDFNPGCDPYNSLDRWPLGRDGRLVILNTAEDVRLFVGPSELETALANRFFDPQGN